MVSPVALEQGKSNAPSFSDPELIDEMERIAEPAILYLPGGRIASVNSVAERLSDLRLSGVP
jgi:hypothetical protein